MRISRFYLVFALLLAGAVHADPLQHELLLLPSAIAVGTFDRHSPDTQIYDQVVQVDALLSLQKGPLKLFGEYLLSDHEGDLERFQLGWQLSSDTVIWIGRYHQPTSVWNHEHHHGQYLQTSISRPWIDEWEDLRGALPQHFTGVLIESTHPVFDSWRLRMAAGGGIAPKITDEGLEAYDLVHPDSTHRMGYQARASLHPDEFSETGFGVLAAADALAADGLRPEQTGNAPLDHVDLQLFGAFGAYEGEGWKISGTLYHAEAQLHYLLATRADSFWVGYVEGEQRFARDFTGFARYEQSVGAGDSPYLKLFDQFARQRAVAGVRWDFVERQALTVQLTNSHMLNGRFSDIRLQWSAALF
jgi:hypothetical protein